MVTPLESKQIPKEQEEKLLRKSRLRFEKIQGRDTVIYCPMCVDPKLNSVIKQYEGNPDFDVIDFTCNDCRHEIYKNDNEDGVYRRRDSYNNLRMIHGHRDSYKNRLGDVLRGDKSNNKSN